jgi:hypothetical protein
VSLPSYPDRGLCLSLLRPYPALPVSWIPCGYLCDLSFGLLALPCSVSSTPTPLPPCSGLLSRFVASYSHPPTPVNLRGVCQNRLAARPSGSGYGCFVRAISAHRIYAGACSSTNSRTSCSCELLDGVGVLPSYCTPRHGRDGDSWE